MKHFYTLLLFFVPFLSQSQSTWERLYGTSNSEFGADIIVTSDTSYVGIAAGTSSMPLTYIVKTDTNGVVKWTKQVNGINPISIIELNSYYFINGKAGSKAALMKVSPSGNVIWTRIYSSTSEQCNSNLTCDNSGNLVGAGKNLFIKYEPNSGNVILTKSYTLGLFTSILKTTTGEYILGGLDVYNLQATVPTANNQYFAKVNSMGDTIWTVNSTGAKDRNSGSLVSISQIIEDDSSFVAVSAGYDTQFHYNTSEFFQFGKNGKFIRYTTTGLDYSGLYSIVRLSKNNYMGLGYYYLNWQFFDINSSTGYLSWQSYPYQKMKTNLSSGSKIIRLNANSFLAIGGTNIVGHGSYDLCILKMDSNLVTNKYTIEGNVYFDANKNCTGTLAIPNQIIKAKDTLGNFYSTLTDALGHYKFTFAPGQYTITHVPEFYKNVRCPSSNEYLITLSSSTPVATKKDFYDTTFLANQPILELYATMDRHRPCLRSSFTLTYFNHGPVSAQNVPIKLTVDNEITLLSSSIPYTINGSSYIITVPNIPPFSQGKIFVVDSASCNPEFTGKTICVSASIAKDSFYYNNNSQWDHSNITVNGKCINGDSVKFVIKNTGSDMNFTSTYRLYESNGLKFINNFKLNKNDSLVYVIEANGAVFRLEADQHPFYPLNSRPQATVQSCGKDILFYPAGLYNSVADDQNYYTHTKTCTELTNSHDPNDKEVLPTGITESKFVKSKDRLTYNIYFQNTGTDTAYTIIVRDTLSSFLDPTTISVEGASHSYSWQLTNNVVQFTFENINLPDSTTNELKSKGYLTFRIYQKKGNAKGTIIRNKADIYFDYNSPVTTQMVFNTINDDTIIAIPPPPAKGYFMAPDSICEGGKVEFSVNADLADVKYYWKKNDTIITNANSSSYSINQVQKLNQGQYQVVMISNSGTKIFKKNLSVKSTPKIITSGTGIEICDGNSIDLSTSFTDKSSALGITKYYEDPALSTVVNNPGKVSQAGTYYIYKLSSGNCADTGSVKLKVNPVPHLESILPAILSNGGYIDLSNYYKDTMAVSGSSYFYKESDLSTSISSIISESGSYQVVKISDQGCSDTVTIAVSKVTGINSSSDNENSVKVYPNPFTDYLIIDSNNDQVKLIEIVDLTGNVIYSSSFVSNTKIEVSKFVSGSYLIKIKSNETNATFMINKK